jgi:triosephosphate isomerase
MKRRFLAGTGWKMNLTAAETPEYARELLSRLADTDLTPVELFVLPPFTSLQAASTAFAGTEVGIGAQNMHWEDSGSWTGEVSAPMLIEAGCRYIELAHSERLEHFGETYERVRLKVNATIQNDLTPILCLGETAEDKRLERADAILGDQLRTALKDQPASAVPKTILAYEPRWAIGGDQAASPAYVAERHAALRGLLFDQYGPEVAKATRIIYGGSVTPGNGAELVGLPNVDGLFVGRAAWSPEGFADIVKIVVQAAYTKESTQ